MKSDYSGEIVGRQNVNSYAVKVNGTGQVTVRNRASLRKIPTPVPIHRPVIGPSVSRPASGPRSGLAVPPAPIMVSRSSPASGPRYGLAVPPALSMVSRSSLKVGNVPRQISIMKGLN